MFSLEQKTTIYKILMLLFAFVGFVSLSFNIVLTHQYAHAVNILIEHMRVIHNTEITTEELKSHIMQEQNHELNFTKEIKAILESRDKNESEK